MADASTTAGNPRVGRNRTAAAEERNGPEPSETADADRPLASYAALGAAFTGTFGGLLIAARGRLPERFSAADLALVTVATHKLSRTIARDRVTRPLRAPFTDVQGEDPPLELNERASGHGPRRALGELLSCPYCLDQWIAGAFIGGLVLAPRQTRATAAMFTAATGSDLLQHVHRWARTLG